MPLKTPVKATMKIDCTPMNSIADKSCVIRNGGRIIHTSVCAVSVKKRPMASSAFVSGENTRAMSDGSAALSLSLSVSEASAKAGYSTSIRDNLLSSNWRDRGPVAEIAAFPGLASEAEQQRVAA